MKRFLMSLALCVTILAGLNTVEAAGRGKSGGKAASKRQTASKAKKKEPKRARRARGNQASHPLNVTRRGHFYSTNGGRTWRRS
jgi:hypothetical protein